MDLLETVLRVMNLEVKEELIFCEFFLISTYCEINQTFQGYFNCMQ